MKKLAFIIILIIPFKLFAQNNNNKEFNLGLNFGVIPLGETKLISNFTYGAEAELLFGLSKSVMLGGNLSYNRATGKNAQESFSYLPLQIVSKWYPKILIKKTTNDAVNTGNFYLKGELGHSFSKFKDDAILNSNAVSFGYLFKLVNNQGLDLSIAPNRKNGFNLLTNDGISFSSISVKYSF